jgi:hypothetical protein
MDAGKVDPEFNPKVSIVIPVYNGSNYLRTAVDSALAQTYSNIEVIVVNDGSRDEGKTEAIARSYGDRIRYFAKENGGVATALNLGIGQMQGEYFSWLSHDDVYYPEKVHSQIEFLRYQHDRNIIVYSDFDFINYRGDVLESYYVKHLSAQEFRLHFIMGGIIHGCTLLVPKVCFTTSGTFNPALKYTQDFALWFEFSKKFKFIHLPGKLIQSREHPGQDSKKNRPAQVVEGNRVHSACLRQIPIREITRYWSSNPADYYFQFARRMEQDGFLGASRFAMLCCLKAIPWVPRKERKKVLYFVLTALSPGFMRKYKALKGSI